MWWRLSTAPGSDPATKPRARAVIHKARWASEAELRFRGSATGLRGAKCDLQPSNIFPEWPDVASDRGGTCGEPHSPILLLLALPNLNMPRDTRTDPEKEKKRK